MTPAVFNKKLKQSFMSLLNNNSAKAVSTTPIIQSDISSLIEIAATIDDQPILNSLKELSAKLASNRFYLVIVGLFKRGKSSLINALIEKELAPVAVTPLTSVITFFECGLDTKAEYSFIQQQNSSVQ